MVKLHKVATHLKKRYNKDGLHTSKDEVTPAWGAICLKISENHNINLWMLSQLAMESIQSMIIIASYHRLIDEAL